MGRTGLVQRPEHVDLADIVYQGEPRTRPLYIHFRFGAYRASVHVFLYTDIGGSTILIRLWAESVLHWMSNK
jgi:hypothetical protein